MKRILFSLAAVFMLLTTFTSCSNDDDNDNTFKPQTYNGWSKVVFGYGSMFDADETISVSESTVTFHSNTWGDGSFNVSELKLNSDGSYSVAGTGTLTMAGHGGTKDYEANITGRISKDSQSFIITVPSVMGGTVLNISVGQIPVVAVIDGTYKGATYANCKYFQHYQPTENEKVVVKANDALDAASLSYTSETWGTFTFESINVTKNEDGSYTLSGEGKTLMPSMKGGTTEYAASFEGTINDGSLVATFSVPAVMGGTTVLFNASDFAEVLAEAQVENSSK